MHLWKYISTSFFVADIGIKTMVNKKNHKRNKFLSNVFQIVKFFFITDFVFSPNDYIHCKGYM